jgi:hypothetical protein
VRITTTDFDYVDFEANGADLLFVDSDGTVLPHDVDEWNDGAESLVWVRVPRVEASTLDWITLYWKRPGGNVPEQPNQVWSGWTSVHHLGADLVDVTGNGHDGSGATLPTPGVGPVGAGRDFDGIDDRIELSGEAAYDYTTTMTLSLWLRVPAFDVGWQAAVTKADNSWRLHRGGDSNQLAFTTTHSGGTSRFDSVQAVTGDSWLHVVGVYDGAQKHLYIDGAIDRTVSYAQTLNENNAAVWVGANGTHGGREWIGAMDELRLSSAPRSALWVNAEHASMTGALTSLGALESGP